MNICVAVYAGNTLHARQVCALHAQVVANTLTVHPLNSSLTREIGEGKGNGLDSCFVGEMRVTTF